MLPCPKGKHCPVATVVPRDCLQGCRGGEGQRRFSVTGATLLILAVVGASFAYLHIGQYFLVQRARREKETKLEAKATRRAKTDHHSISMIKATKWSKGALQ